MNIQIAPPALQLAGGLPQVVPHRDYINGNNPWKGKFDYPFKGDQENTQNAGTITWNFAPWASIKSISAFQEHTLGGEKFDDDGTTYPIVGFNGRDTDDKFFSQELNLGGTNKWFTWIVGAYYGYENYSSAFPDYILFSKLRGAARGREKLNDYSGFGDTTIPLPFNFSLFGGVRYTYDRKALNQTVALGSVGGPLFPYGPAFGTCLQSKFVDDFHNVSYRVGMGWAPLETVNFYIKNSTGYNAGGHYFNGCANGYKPETLDSIEGGVKGKWFDGRLVVDAAGYYNDFRNYQIFQLSANHIETLVINAPELETYGGEFQVTALPTENLTVNLGLSLMHSQYDNFFDSNTSDPAAGFENLSGKQIERAPNHTEQVGLEYDWPVPWGRILSDSTRRFLDLGTLRLRGEWFHTDYIVFLPFGKTGYDGSNDVQHPYSIFNAYATLPTEDGKWTLRFFAKNFTNTKYYSYKFNNFWAYTGVGGMPPWFGGDLTYKF